MCARTCLLTWRSSAATCSLASVAVIGSVFSTIYLHKLATTPMHALPVSAYAAARSSVAAALAIARHAADSPHLIQDVTTSFMAGLHVACVVAALICWAGAIGALRLPGRQQAGTAVKPDTGTQRVPAASPGSPGDTDS